jgi:hypothetical protein
MKRNAIIVVVVLHILAAIILITRISAVIYLVQSPELEFEAIRSIWIQTIILSMITILLLAGIVGLWLSRPWGWKSAAIADIILVILVVCDWLFGGERVDHVPVILFLAVLMLPLFIPRIRGQLSKIPESPP